MDDNGFVAGLFNIKVESQDGEIKCNYYDYLTKYASRPWWEYVAGWIKNLFPKEDSAKGRKEFDPYYLSKKEDGVAKKIRKNITINIDKKTSVITIEVDAQDPLICRSLADSVKERLQVFITNYRTNKSRIDEEYYKKLALSSKAEYEKARQLYSSYSDSNMDIMLESYRAKQTDLENDMQLKYNTYTTIMTQYQAARAKVQERTPAFTLVKGAAVPVKPSGPKRMLFVIAMCFLATITLTLYCCKELIFKE